MTIGGVKCAKFYPLQLIITTFIDAAQPSDLSGREFFRIRLYHGSYARPSDVVWEGARLKGWSICFLLLKYHRPALVFPGLRAVFFQQLGIENIQSRKALSLLNSL